MMMMMMQQLRQQRLMSFSAIQGKRYMCMYYYLPRNRKDFLMSSSFPPPSPSLPPCPPHVDDEITASRDFQKVMNILSNASSGYQIHSRLNALDLTNILEQHQQHFPLKVIQTSWQSKVVLQPYVSPHNLILFIKWVWNYKTHLITTPVLEYLVSTLCSNNLRPESQESHKYSFSFYNNSPYSQKKNDILFLWNFLKKIGQDQTGLLNTRILNKLIQFFKGKAALEVFHKFEVFQCLPNQDTYYFTLQALMRTTRCTADMIHQAASICQNMMLLPPDVSESQDDSDDYGLKGYDGHPPLDIWSVLQVLQDGHPPLDGNLLKTCSYMNDLTTNDVLFIIKLSVKNDLIETPKVSHRNLIHFMKWVWRRRNSNESLYKDLITTPVLESLVSAVCCDFVMKIGEPHFHFHDVERKNDVLLLWDLLKHIGLYQNGLLNAQILNKLIDFFGLVFDGKPAHALQVFHKFEVFHCVPNQDTYYFTLQAVKTARCSAYMLRQAASICQKMLLHRETLRHDIHTHFDMDSDHSNILYYMLCWFSKNNMVKEAYTLCQAANEKRKRNPKWSPKFNRVVPFKMVRKLCSKKQTVHLASEVVTGTPAEVEDLTKDLYYKEVVRALCGFKDFDAAKQLIFKMIADGQKSEDVFDTIIKAYVKAGEVGQALEMVILMESIGLWTCDVLYIDSKYCIRQIRKILEEAKRKDFKSIIALLYDLLIVQSCRLHNFDEAHKFLTQMKDFGVSYTNIDEYHKLINTLQKLMDRKMSREKLEEREHMDRKKAKAMILISKMNDRDMEEAATKQLEEMHLNIRAHYDCEL